MISGIAEDQASRAPVFPGLELLAEAAGPGQRTVAVPVGELILGMSLRIDGADPAHVAQLAEMLDELPPIVVHRPSMRVVDGLHRVAAARVCGRSTVLAVMFDGTEDESLVLGLRLNARHGLPLSRRDRQAAVERVLIAHPDWSDRRIGSLTGVSPRTVARQRSRSSENIAHLTTRTGLDGRIRPVSRAEARRRVSEILIARPEASARRVAAEAGVAVATVSDVRRRLSQGLDAVPDSMREFPVQAAPAAPSGAVRCTAKMTEAQREALIADVGIAVGKLNLDPAMRGSFGGRLLLRSLHVHAQTLENLRAVIGAVPSHQAQSIASIARRYGACWTSLAEQLEQRR